MFKDKQYYLDNTTQTFNGVVYKDYEAFKTGNGVCYICEGDLDALENGASLESVAETRQTILEKCKDYCPSKMTLEQFAFWVFDFADWTCIETILYEADELLEDYYE